AAADAARVPRARREQGRERPRAPHRPPLALSPPGPDRRAARAGPRQPGRPAAADAGDPRPGAAPAGPAARLRLDLDASTRVQAWLPRPAVLSTPRSCAGWRAIARSTPCRR